MQFIMFGFEIVVSLTWPNKLSKVVKRKF